MSPSENRTRSGRLLYVVPDPEWYRSGEWQRGYCFIPAFRDDVGMASGESADNYGRSSARLFFYLTGSDRALGVVQFAMYTGWNIEDAEDWGWQRQRTAGDGPMAADLVHHSPTPRYDDQTEIQCDLLPGRTTCYGSGLNAEPVMRRFIREGAPAVWEELENYYTSIFKEGAGT